MTGQGWHLDEDDAAGELPIVQRRPGELVKTCKLLASTSLANLGATISMQMANVPKIHFSILLAKKQENSLLHIYD